MAAAFYRNAIGFYRRRISPYKGFRCAHAALHGGPSCSHAVEALLVQHGLIRVWPLIRARFAGCRAAARSLAMAMESDEVEVPEEAGDEAGTGKQPRKRRKRMPRAGCGDLGDEDCSDLDCCVGMEVFDGCDALGGCDACDIGSCDIF